MELIKDCFVPRNDDKNGNWITPEPGLLTAEEQKKCDALQKRIPVTIKLD